VSPLRRLGVSIKKGSNLRCSAKLIFTDRLLRFRGHLALPRWLFSAAFGLIYKRFKELAKVKNSI